LARRCRLQDGDEANVGGMSGWLTENEFDVYFSAKFASSERFGSIWLLLQAAKTISSEKLDRFVSSLESH
jgi:hypothetical protein